MIVENKNIDIILPRPEFLEFTPELPMKRDNSIQVCIPCEEENYRDISYNLQFVSNQRRAVRRPRPEARTGYYISLQSLTECVCAMAFFLTCIIVIIILSFLRVID